MLTVGRGSFAQSQTAIGQVINRVQETQYAARDAANAAPPSSTGPSAAAPSQPAAAAPQTAAQLAMANGGGVAPGMQTGGAPSSLNIPRKRSRGSGTATVAGGGVGLGIPT